MPSCSPQTLQGASEAFGGEVRHDALDSREIVAQGPEGGVAGLAEESSDRAGLVIEALGDRSRSGRGVGSTPCTHDGTGVQSTNAVARSTYASTHSRGVWSLPALADTIHASSRSSRPSSVKMRPILAMFCAA